MSIFTKINGFINKDALLIKKGAAYNRKERRQMEFEEKRLKRVFNWFEDYTKEYSYDWYLKAFLQNCRYVEFVIKPKYFEVNRYYFKNKFKRLARF